MKIASLLLRQSYIDALSSLSYHGVSIPVFDEYVISGYQLPVIPISTYLQPKAYVLVKNQTVNDASLKCGINQNMSLQLDVVTVYDSDSGGFKLSELIAQKICNLIFTSNKLNISNVELNIWKGVLESTTNISEESQTNRIYRTVLLLNHTVQQIELTT